MVTGRYLAVADGDGGSAEELEELDFLEMVVSEWIINAVVGFALAAGKKLIGFGYFGANAGYLSGIHALILFRPRPFAALRFGVNPLARPRVPAARLLYRRLLLMLLAIV